jgi:7-keto-8-aminopelargonate synthetase-like enzyme
MDGDLAKLDRIVELADRYDAIVMVDDSHATGVLGPNGRGTPAHFGLADRVDIVTSTLGKSLGGAAGGFTSGRAEIVELLRQRSRPYLFSNALPPVIAAAALQAVNLVAQGDMLRARLKENAELFRGRLTALGFPARPWRSPDHSCDAGRRHARVTHGGEAPAGRHLRRRVQLSRRAERPGAHSRADVRRPYQSPVGTGRLGVCESRRRTRYYRAGVTEGGAGFDSG